MKLLLTLALGALAYGMEDLGSWTDHSWKVSKGRIDVSMKKIDGDLTKLKEAPKMQWWPASNTKKTSGAKSYGMLQDKNGEYYLVFSKKEMKGTAVPGKDDEVAVYKYEKESTSLERDGETDSVKFTLKQVNAPEEKAEQEPTAEEEKPTAEEEKPAAEEEKQQEPVAEEEKPEAVVEKKAEPPKKAAEPPKKAPAAKQQKPAAKAPAKPAAKQQQAPKKAAKPASKAVSKKVAAKKAAPAKKVAAKKSSFLETEEEKEIMPFFFPFMAAPLMAAAAPFVMASYAFGPHMLNAGAQSLERDTVDMQHLEEVDAERKEEFLPFLGPWGIFPWMAMGPWAAAGASLMLPAAMAAR